MKVKFFILEYFSPSDSNFANEAIIIAQGLRAEGITFFANIDYWLDPIENELLFKKAPADFDADIHVYFDSFYFIKDMNRFAEVDYSKINVLVDRSDELIPHWQTPKFSDYKKFDLMLIDHYHLRYNYPAGYNIKPWQIGFDQRVIDYSNNCNDHSVRNDIILDTFRLPHNLRLLAINEMKEGLKNVYPTQRVITDTLNDETIKQSEVDKIYWALTGKRHNPSYFYQLNSALLTYVFGGFYHLNPPAFDIMSKIMRRVNKAGSILYPLLGKDNGGFYFIYQWDSFRLWEALVTDTCPIFLDFEDWGFKLPINPINGEHYIGVKGFDFKTTIEQIKKMPKEQIREIGLNGKQWAIENYGPKAIGRRFINEVQATKRFKELNISKQ